MPSRGSMLVALGALLASPATGALRERCAWSGSPDHPAFADVQMTPLVIDLDGDTDPEVVFIGMEPVFGAGFLEIISGADCNTLLEVGSPGCVRCFGDADCRDLDPHQDGTILRAWGLAAGDLDGDGVPEIVGVSEAEDRVVVFGADGSFRWCSEAVPTPFGMTALHSVAPALADLDGDGRPEVIVGPAVFSAEGQLLRVGSDWPLFQPPAVPTDVDADGIAEVSVGPALLASDGSTIWDRRALDEGWAGGSPADLDGDGLPEIVLTGIEPNRIVVVDGQSGVARASALLPASDPACWAATGTAAIGEVDGDADPELAAATGTSVCLFDWSTAPLDALTERWCVPVRDCGGGWVNPVFADIDGDGLAEVVLHDEFDLRVLGRDGTLLERISSSASTFRETVVVADVDNDCAGEILVPADTESGGTDRGLRIFEGDPTPLPAHRTIWNQMAYHVDNVNDDGSIPQIDAPGRTFHAQVEAPEKIYDVRAATTVLWPPNHRMVRIALTEAGGAPLRVVGVYQDEPVDDRADGRSRPDAVIDRDSVLLRAERSGRGDGRTYHVEVLAGRAGCEMSTSLTVCVPHDQRRSRRDGSCGDQGPLFDSLALRP